MSEIEKVELDSLVGEHILDGVDMSAERVEIYGGNFQDAGVIRFRLDGKVYTAVENPEDGYRSCMEHVFIEDCKISNAFPPIRVLARKRGNDPCADDVLELIDVITEKVVVEVGTGDMNDYYPYFVSAFHPENMATNNV